MDSDGVPRSHEVRKRKAGIVIAIPSIRKQDENVVMTNLVVIEPGSRPARGHLNLCDRENSLREGNE